MTRLLILAIRFRLIVIRFRQLGQGVILAASLAGIAPVFAQVQFPQGEFPLTDFERSSISIDEIMTGGPPRDGIPSIDDPTFVSISAASEWLDSREPVIALNHEGEARAYPIQILMYHEIVNDVIGDTPVSITFCPLCNASIVFDRTVAHEDETNVLDFGTTGRLRNSDLVMYDRQTESWWQQFTGQGIIGKYTDTTLLQLPSQIVSFAEFSEAYADASVLSRETGFNRPYGNNPYRGYDAIDNNPFLFRGEIDSRLPAMERVLSIRLQSATQLIPLSPLLEQPLLNLTLDQKPVAVFAASTAASALDAGKIADSRAVPSAAAFSAVVNDKALSFKLLDGAIIDQQTGSEWNAFGQAVRGPLKSTQLLQLDQGVHFAFAWLAFDPAAVVVELP